MFATMVMACASIAFAGNHTDSTALTVVSSDVIYFETTGEHAQLQLTISAPDGTVTQRVFDGWDIPSFEVFNAQGEAIMDGVYAFEIWATPQIDRAKNNDGNRIAIPEEQVPMIHSGHFRVSQGQFVLPGAEEFQPVRSGPAVIQTVNKDDETPSGGPIDADEPGEDQVILDDLIVDGSACVGFDCVNGEVFGFDTIRLKENNMRIKFDDTSTSASFPNNDWQITANDSANGGANKFSIDDISGSRTPFTIEASAPSHSLYVDDGGRVGLGTSTPSVELHVVNGDSPTLRLEQNGSSGFTPQTWDLAGNETNFFVRDATNGSQLPLRIRPGADTNSIFVDVDNSVGLGTASPAAHLHVEGQTTSAEPLLLLQETTAGEHVDIRYNHTNTTSAGAVNWLMRINGNNGRVTLGNDGVGIPFKFDPTAQNSLFQVGIDKNGVTDSDLVSMVGSLYVTGDITAEGTITPDYVFEPDYQLMPIDEHAEKMWRNKHLPFVEPAVTDENGKGVVKLNQRAQGVLEELEIAHIYIQQLNQTIRELEARIEKIEQQ